MAPGTRLFDRVRSTAENIPPVPSMDCHDKFGCSKSNGVRVRTSLYGTLPPWMDCSKFLHFIFAVCAAELKSIIEVCPRVFELSCSHIQINLIDGTTICDKFVAVYKSAIDFSYGILSSISLALERCKAFDLQRCLGLIGYTLPLTSDVSLSDVVCRVHRA